MDPGTIHLKHCRFIFFPLSYHGIFYMRVKFVFAIITLGYFENPVVAVLITCSIYRQTNE